MTATARTCRRAVFVLLASAATAILAGTDPLSGWKRSAPPRVFNRTSIFNYIDGAAELYLEFGFERLNVERYAKNGAELTVETYGMDLPASALGIYLMKCGPETPAPGFDIRHSANPYQLMAVKGKTVCVVNNPDGAEALIPVMVGLARRAMAHVPVGESVPFLEMLPPEGRIPGSERIVRGRYGVESVYGFGENDALGLGGRAFGVAANYRDAQGFAFTRIRVGYGNPAGADSALRAFASRLDASFAVLEKTHTRLVFRDYLHQYGVAESTGSFLDLRVRLVEASVADNPASENPGMGRKP